MSVRFEGAPALVHEVVAIVPDDAEDHRHPAGRQHLAGQGLGVDIPDLSFAGHLVHRHHFVTGGDDAHPGAPENGRLRPPAGGQQPGLLGTDPRACFQCRLGMPDVLALFDDMLARGHTPIRLDGGVVKRIGVFHHDDAVCALGQHAAGGDPGRLTGTDGKVGPAPHPDLPAYVQIGGVGLGCAEGGGRLDGKSVHGGPVEIGNVHIGVDILGRYPTQTVGQRHRLRIHR